MSKLDETNKLIDYITGISEKGTCKIDNTVFLADIAKSLAMIADKICEVDHE